MVCTKFLQFLETRGDNSYGQLEMSFLYPTPQPNALYNLTEFPENSSKVSNEFMDRQMDGWIPCW